MASSFGTRLRHERMRRNLNQADFGKIGGVQKNAQYCYEKDEAMPSVSYLLQLVKAGVNATYLIYGDDTPVGGEQPVGDLLALINELSPAQQAMGFAILQVLRLGGHGMSAGPVEAENIWCLTTLFGRFLSLDERGRALVNVAIQGAMIAPMADENPPSTD